MDILSERITNEKRHIEIKSSDIISALTILFLSGVVITFLVLNINMIKKMRSGSNATIVYSTAQTQIEEEPKTLRIDF